MAEGTFDTLVNAAIEAKPVDFDRAMTDILHDRVSQLVADRKLDIAQNFFGPQDATVEVGDDEESDLEPDTTEDDNSEDDNQESPEEE